MQTQLRVTRPMRREAAVHELHKQLEKLGDVVRTSSWEVTRVATKKADVPIEKTAWFKRKIEEDRQLKRAAAERRARLPDQYGFRRREAIAKIKAENVAGFTTDAEMSDMSTDLLERTADHFRSAGRRTEAPKPYDIAVGRSIFDPPHLKTAATLENGEAPKPYDIALGRSIFDPPTAARETA